MRPAHRQQGSASHYVEVNGHHDNPLRGAVYEAGYVDGAHQDIDLNADDVAYMEDLPVRGYRRPYRPVQVRQQEVHTGGRRTLTLDSSNRWKNFKIRSQYNLLQTEALARSIINENADRLNNHGWRMRQRQAHDWAGSVHWNTSSDLPRQRLDSARQYSEAEHYMNHFEALEDWPRHAAATKHRDYSFAAINMAKVGVYRPSLGTFGHQDVIREHEHHLERAKKAHELKEMQFPSKDRPEW
ncbi:hypothetical protein CBS101457_005092 [Exobasidium rhododendri]|nr:hypothetical protein CBS101457_005092 [Exobasidium rhododendri]